MTSPALPSPSGVTGVPRGVDLTMLLVRVGTAAGLLAALTGAILTAFAAAPPLVRSARPAEGPVEVPSS